MIMMIITKVILIVYTTALFIEFAQFKVHAQYFFVEGEVSGPSTRI